MLEGDQQKSRAAIFGLNRATREFVGGVLYVMGLAGLSALAGLLPFLDLRSATVMVICVEFFALVGMGGIMFIAALRRDGLSWSGSFGILLILAVLCTVLIYVPLWFVLAAERSWL